MSGLRALLHRVHERLLGTGMGERTTSVLRGIAWVAPAAMIARLLTGVATLLTARWLEPEAWGHANLALAASLWLQVPLLLGVTSALMHAIPRADAAERVAWARTGALLLLITATVTLAAGWIFRAPLAALNGASVPEFVGGLTWCAGHVVYLASISALSGLERFAQRAFAEVAFAVAFPAMVFGMKAAGVLTWQGYLQAMAAGYGIAGLSMYLFGGAPAPGLGPGTMERAKRLLAFGGVAALSLVASALVQAVGRQVTSRYFPVADVGVLSAYQNGSVQVATYAQSLLAMVFFPIASRTPDRNQLFNKVARLLGPLALGSAVAFSGVLLAWMLLLGRKYPLQAAPFVAFSIAAGLAMAYYVALWMLASAGPHGMAAATFTQLVNGGANLVACLVLVPRLGVLGAGIATAIGMAAGIGAAFLPPVRRWAGVAAA